MNSFNPIRSVQESSLVCLLLALLGIIVDQFAIFLIVQAHLQLLNVVIEQVFVLLMLGLERDNLVVSLFSDFRDSLVVLVLLLRILPVRLDLLVVPLALSLR